MIIADRELAFVPLFSSQATETAGDALLIRPSGLLDALQVLFDLVWESSAGSAF